VGVGWCFARRLSGALGWSTTTENQLDFWHRSGGTRGSGRIHDGECVYMFVYVVLVVCMSKIDEVEDLGDFLE